MVSTCKYFVKTKHQLAFNPTKLKLMCFTANIDETAQIVLIGQPVNSETLDILYNHDILYK